MGFQIVVQVGDHGELGVQAPAQLLAQKRHLLMILEGAKYEVTQYVPPAVIPASPGEVPILDKNGSGSGPGLRIVS